MARHGLASSLLLPRPGCVWFRPSAVCTLVEQLGDRPCVTERSSQRAAAALAPVLGPQTHQSPTWLPTAVVGVASHMFPGGLDAQGGGPGALAPAALSWKRLSREVWGQSYVFSEGLGTTDVGGRLHRALLRTASEVSAESSAAYLCGADGHPRGEALGPGRAEPKVRPRDGAPRRETPRDAGLGFRSGSQSCIVGPHLRRLGLRSWQEPQPSPATRGKFPPSPKHLYPEP